MPAWQRPEHAAALVPIFPIAGEVLHNGDGQPAEGGLRIKVKIFADIAAFTVLYIQGKRVTGKSGLFEGEVIVQPGENRLVIGSTPSEQLLVLPVSYAPHVQDTYRVSVDDAIWFLRDIHQQRARYRSIFENPYLAGLKNLHDTYGAKIHLNIFYETEGFDLSQMTDQYREEWIANANWLRLSVHAWAEFPDNPYRNADYQTMAEHSGAIQREISRFAGPQLMDNTTTLHWGEVPVEVCRALRDKGYTTQVCDFNVDNNLAPCSYYLTVPQRRHLQQRFLWKDYQEGITFVKSSVIVDTVKAAQLEPLLDNYLTEGRKPPYADFLVHEQYFYKDYARYHPDYMEKLEICVKWAVKHGYKPVFVSEALSV